MLRKRIIFTLLYDSGYFVLSRNFRLQKAGTIEWLNNNYNFSSISFYIDELVVLDISRNVRNPVLFCDTLKELSSGCFLPISAGGGIRSVEDAYRLLRSGADKIVLNTSLFEDLKLVNELSQQLGQQCIVGSVDFKRSSSGAYRIHTQSGMRLIDKDCSEALNWINGNTVGEIYINSIDQDGTGQGYDFKLLDLLPNPCPIPVIMAGGVGNAMHLIEGFMHNSIDAVATANLFNFIGDGLKHAREKLINQGALLAQWPELDADLLRNHLPPPKK